MVTKGPKEYYSVKNSKVGNNRPASSNKRSVQDSNHQQEMISSDTNEKFNNMDQIKVHRGPLNLNAITMRDPNVVMEEICQVVSRLNISHKKLGKFNIKCEFKDLKFIVEINNVEKFSNLFIIKFYKNNQANNQYFDICSNIFAMLNL